MQPDKCPPLSVQYYTKQSRTQVKRSGAAAMYLHMYHAYSENDL